jgi:hypothetical protein|tara:strand:+ start:102 stop:224 length:123 start_codon:yes stop_codon:yes gene_type:complete
MAVNLANVDYALLGITLSSALCIGAFIIYVWTHNEEKYKK